MQTVETLPAPGSVVIHRATGQQYQVLENNRVQDMRTERVLMDHHLRFFPRAYDLIFNAEAVTE